MFSLFQVTHFPIFLLPLYKIVPGLTIRYKTGKMTEAKWIQRMIFLESVAGVPVSHK